MPERHTNLIVFVTDDQGYGDLACHGNPIVQTPHMDELHSQSVRFTDFHVDPTCSPSRSSLMTGCYSHRVNVWHTIMGRNYMDQTRTTMPEVFRNAGYRTAHFGKWHLGGHRPYRPIDRGFDEWLGQGDGGTGCMTDYWGNRRVDDVYIHNGDQVHIPGYGPDVFFDAALDYISKSSEQPFFIYLATYIPHDPNSIPDQSWADRYRDRVPVRTSYFYSAIEGADRNLGRLVAKLSELGIEDDTILLFMTDNGTAQGEKVFNAGMRGKKTSVYEGGHRVPCFIRWPAGRVGGTDTAVGRDIPALATHMDLLPTLADLAGIPVSTNQSIDGVSLAETLRDATASVPERTLVVENQRIRHPRKGKDYAVMRDRWRLVNGSELYNVEDDPGQEHDISSDHPELVSSMAGEYERYWNQVSRDDEQYERPIVGSPSDAGGSVTLCVEHMMPDEELVVFNQHHVVVGARATGFWPIAVDQAGTYRIECRRWPQELDAPIRGVPDPESLTSVYRNDRGSAFLWDEEVTRTLYGSRSDEEDGPVALDVEAIRLTSGTTTVEIPVTGDSAVVAASMSLAAGPVELRAEMIDPDSEVVGSAYYVSVSRV